MIHLRSFARQLMLSVTLMVGLAAVNPSMAQDGKALFQTNCASCHAVKKDLTGPALAGIQERVPDKKLLYDWIRNNQKVLATGDKYFNDLYAKWNKTAMSLFPNLSDAEIDAILTYVDTEAKKSDAAPKGAAAAAPEANNNNDLLFGILTIIMGIVALILLQVNRNLKRMADEATGEPLVAPIPWYRSKKFLVTVALGLFIVGGIFINKWAVNMGRSKDYTPEQPIFYSHKVHAGINQVNCLYCHGGAQESKHANIPSVNVCMNCHMAINEYSGEDLYTEDGKKVDGTAEIQKLYEYAGYEKGKPWDPSKAKNIEWVKIHNLPDHVYFNHAQHVTAGKQQCQTCHGEIQKMDEVYQFTDLSMGWCINCHRESKVQFTENKFYSIYEKFHNDLKAGKVDSITVEKIGGTECQKCHY